MKRNLLEQALDKVIEKDLDQFDQVRADKEERELDYQEAELHPSEG